MTTGVADTEVHNYVNAFNMRTEKETILNYGSDATLNGQVNRILPTANTKIAGTEVTCYDAILSVADLVYLRDAAFASVGRKVCHVGICLVSCFATDTDFVIVIPHLVESTGLYLPSDRSGEGGTVAGVVNHRLIFIVGAGCQQDNRECSEYHSFCSPFFTFNCL